jgi:hypothetical protein
MTRGLDPLSGLPVYRQIADTLRQRIETCWGALAEW